MTVLYTSDNTTNGFDATTAGSLPAGWVSTIGTWTAGTLDIFGSHTHTLGGELNSGDIALYTGIAAITDCDVIVSFLATTSSTLGLAFRSNSTASTLYKVQIGGGNAVLYGPSGQIGLASCNLTAGQTYTIHAQAQGTTLRVNVWNAASAEPSTWMISVVDTQITTAGYAGVLRTGGPDSTTPSAAGFSVSDFSTAEAITVNTPGSSAAGSQLHITGTYSGTPSPTSLSYSLDGGAYVAATTPTITGGNYSFFITAPATGSHTVQVEDPATSVASPVSSSFSTFTAAVIDPSSSAILYSPYNWNVTAGLAQTNNAGAYFRTLFSGTSCALAFDLTNNVTDYPQLWVRIDNGPLTQYNIAASIALTIPGNTAGASNVPYHSLEVYIKSVDVGQNRWNVPVVAGVSLKGIILDSAAVAVQPLAAPRNILIFGDSITEGVDTENAFVGAQSDHSDSSMAYAFNLGRLLGAEVGVVGFASQGLGASGTGNVPTFPLAYNYLWSGQPRSFSPVADLIVINQGTNDGANNITAAYTTVLNALISLFPTTPIAVLEPFSGNAAAYIQAACAAVSVPGNVHYIDTTGFLNGTYGGALPHPSGPNSTMMIAPAVANAVKGLFSGAAVSVRRWTHS